MAGLRAGFAAELERQGYSQATAGPYLRRFAQLSCWTEAQGLGLCEFSPAVLEWFGAACRAAGYRDYVSIRGNKPMLAFLRATGHCPAEPLPVGPVDESLGRFAGWLSGERHLAPSVERLAAGDRIVLWRLDAAFVRRFVLDTCPRQGRARAKVTVVAVHQLLTFLYVEGAIDRSLVRAVPSVAGARLSGLPKRLGHGEVQRMLDACDRGTLATRSPIICGTGGRRPSTRARCS